MKTFLQYLREMSLDSYRFDFHKDVDKEREGFRTDLQGKRDLGTQVAKGENDWTHPISGRFSGRDRSLVAHPRTLRELENRLSRSGYKFNILFIEDRRVDNNLDYDQQVELFMRENSIEKEGRITFVKNGTTGHILTPWMILHTLGHAIGERLDSVQSGVASNVRERIYARLRAIASIVSGEDCGYLGGSSKPKCNEALGEVFAFKSVSAKEKSTSSNATELYHELFAEFLWNGHKIRIKSPHSGLRNILIAVESIEEEIRVALDNCVGHIIYDYYD